MFVTQEFLAAHPARERFLEGKMMGDGCRRNLTHCVARLEGIVPRTPPLAPNQVR